MISPNERFTRCEAQVLQFEGLWSNNPKDPGGATYRGVTLPALSAYLGRPATLAELHNASPQLIAAVYRSAYWNAVKGDAMAAGIDLMMFDAAVNSGGGRSVVFLQTVLGLPEDGVLGPATLGALARADRLATIRRLAAEREHFLRGLSTFPEFGDGWIKRVDRCQAIALGWAQQDA